MWHRKSVGHYARVLKGVLDKFLGANPVSNRRRAWQQHSHNQPIVETVRQARVDSKQVFGVALVKRAGWVVVVVCLWLVHRPTMRSMPTHVTVVQSRRRTAVEGEHMESKARTGWVAARCFVQSALSGQRCPRGTWH
jgi:hypothetical protein